MPFLRYAAAAAIVVIAGVGIVALNARPANLGGPPPSPSAVVPPPDDGTLPPLTGLPGTLAFRSIVEGAVDVALMQPDRTAFVQLTDDEATNDSGPVISPDGSRILFQRSDSETGAADIWVVNRDGSGEMAVTRTPEYEDWPSWSADGTHAIFTRATQEGGRPMVQIAIRAVTATAESIPADADTVVFARAETGTALDFKPTGSPVDDRLAFSSTMDGAYRLYTIRIDGSDLVEVGDFAAGGRPAWSPDGSMLAFQDFHAGACLWIVDASGGAPRAVSSFDCSGGPVAWSPDGTRLAWAGGLMASQIYIVNADGSDQRMLANSPTYGDLNWGVTPP